MILLIDNYDSFTFNLYQYLCELSSEEVRVVRNDAQSVDELCALKPSHIIISPGPGRPEDAGICVELIRQIDDSIPIFGVCLGLQCIAIAYDMPVISAKDIVHGKINQVEHDGKGIFRSISQPTTCTRYHSLAVDITEINDNFEISAWVSDGEIMGLRHKTKIIEGVQFHPESIASTEGKKMLGNFLNYRREPFIVKDTLNTLLSKQSLSMEEAERWMEEISAGNISPTFLASFLIAFRMKDISPQELAGAALALCKNAKPIAAEGNLLDTCGTGGDGMGSFNISSITALMAAACGARVAKHGNRAVSSQCGSADFYQALGYPLDLDAESSLTVLEQTNFAFLFAPHYHPTMRHASSVRKELGIKTIMNLIGPMTNPAQASHRMVGVYDGAMTNTMAEAARLLQLERALFFSTDDGQDEISLFSPSRGFLLHKDGDIEDFCIEPANFKMPEHAIEALKGGSAEENAAEAWEIARGRGREAIRDAMILNSACALFVYETVPSITDGIALVQDTLHEGKLAEKMEEIIDTVRAVQKRKET